MAESRCLTESHEALGQVVGVNGGPTGVVNTRPLSPQEVAASRSFACRFLCRRRAETVGWDRFWVRQDSSVFGVPNTRRVFRPGPSDLPEPNKDHLAAFRGMIEAKMKLLGAAAPKESHVTHEDLNETEGYVHRLPRSWRGWRRGRASLMPSTWMGTTRLCRPG
jgi:hypothetical protein